MNKRREDPNIELARFVSQFAYDPAGFARACFPWGTGALASYKGPLKWQIEILEEIGKQMRERKFDGVNPVKPIRVAISSGHGIAKTTLSAILASWALCTQPKSKGKVTSQSWTQLEATTWAALKFWLGQSICASWFEIGAQRIRANALPDAWFCTAESPSDDRAQSFAGLHASDSMPWVIVDEASDLSEKIWSVIQGSLTDGSPLVCLFGNCVRNSGVFHDVIFGDNPHREDWIIRVIDSRDVEITNKSLFAEWEQTHGEDSDFFRSRVRGLPPRASSLQFIGSDLIKDAMERNPLHLDDDALVAGADISRGGEDNTVIRFRRGMDAKSIPPIKLSAEITRDSTRVVQVLADLFHRDFGKGLKLSHLFMDETGVGGPLVDRLKEMGHKRVTGINFGSTPPETNFLNMRAYMWDRLRTWLRNGAIENDEDLKSDLIGPGYSYNAQSRLVLESKESMKRRGIGSPDDADALALTFAAPVGIRRSGNNYSHRDTQLKNLRNNCRSSWMG